MEINGDYAIVGLEGIVYLDYDTNNQSLIYDNRTQDPDITAVNAQLLRLSGQQLYYSSSDQQGSIYTLDMLGNNHHLLYAFDFENIDDIVVLDMVVSQGFIGLVLNQGIYNIEGNTMDYTLVLAVYDTNNNSLNILATPSEGSPGLTLIDINSDEIIYASYTHPDGSSVLTKEAYLQQNLSVTYEKYINNQATIAVRSYQFETQQDTVLFSGQGIHTILHHQGTFVYSTPDGIEKWNQEKTAVFDSEFVHLLNYFDEDILIFSTMKHLDDYIIQQHVYSFRQNQLIEELEQFEDLSSVDFFVARGSGENLIGYCALDALCYLDKNDFLNADWSKIRSNNFDPYR